MFSLTFEKHQPSKQSRFKHKMVNVVKDSASIQQTLDDYSVQGWELVSVLDDTGVKLTGASVSGLLMFFKKGM